MDAAGGLWNSRFSEPYERICSLPTQNPIAEQPLWPLTIVGWEISGCSQPLSDSIQPASRDRPEYLARQFDYGSRECWSWLMGLPILCTHSAEHLRYFGAAFARSNCS
jgi:hypothetical protein